MGGRALACPPGHGERDLSDEAMRRLIEPIDRYRQRTRRDGRLIQILEPLHQMLAVHRGSLLPTMRFVRHHGFRVGGGPFAGVRYPRSAILCIPGLVPHLAGTYELELHEAVEALIRSQPNLIINIGSGEGYYAVGMARRCPGAKVLAYEADPYRARISSKVARLNGVDDRIDQQGVCTLDALADLRPPAATAVISDCEGAEAELIDPARVTWLRRSTLLIEVHEFLDPELPAKLQERLEATHSLEWRRPSKRYVLDQDPKYLMGWTADLSPVQQEMLMSELRPVRTPWLWATPSR
jgi:hypothetical protein